MYLNQQDVEEMQEMSFQIQSASEPVPQQIVIGLFFSSFSFFSFFSFSPIYNQKQRVLP